MKERDDKRQLTGTVQIDNVYYGGERHGGKRGRGSENKTPFIAAVSTDKKGHPLYMNFNVLKGFRLSEVARWAKQHLAAGSLVVSDGLSCFTAVTEAKCRHSSTVTGGGPASVTKEQFIWINTMIGNIKNSITVLTSQLVTNIYPGIWPNMVIDSTVVFYLKICCLDLCT